jgi:large conductance mechanosensitive channel
MKALLERLRLKFKKPELPDKLEKPLDTGLEKAGGFIKDFKLFALKGNVIELAIGVIIGAAFKSVVDSLVSDIIMPLLSIVTGNIDFSNRYFNLSGGNFSTLQEAKDAGAVVLTYGNFLNAVINFILISLVIFITIRYVVGQKQKEEKKEEKKDPTKQCPECLQDIKLQAKKCMYCGSSQPKLKLPKEEKILIA